MVRSPPRLGAVPPSESCSNGVVAENIEIVRHARARSLARRRGLATPWSPKESPTSVVSRVKAMTAGAPPGRESRPSSGEGGGYAAGRECEVLSLV